MMPGLHLEAPMQMLFGGKVVVSDCGEVFRMFAFIQGWHDELLLFDQIEELAFRPALGN